MKMIISPTTATLRPITRCPLHRQGEREMEREREREEREGGGWSEYYRAKH